MKKLDYIDKKVIVLDEFEKRIKANKYVDSEFKTFILKVLKKYENELHIINNKIKFDTNFYVYAVTMLRKDKSEGFYYKNFLRLKKDSLIHPSSSHFPKSLTLISINPNQFSLQVPDFSFIDIFDEALEYVKSNITSSAYLYVYFRLFSVNVFSKEQLKSIKIKDIISLSSTKAAMITRIKTNKIFNCNELVNLYVLDTFISSNIKDFLLKDKNEYLFDNINYYEDFTKEFIKQKLENSKLNIIKATNRNHYLLNNTSLELTLNANLVSSVNLTISELAKIYPDAIPDELLELEKKQIDEVFNKEIQSDFYNENKDMERFDIMEFYELQEFLKSKENIVKKELITSIINNLNKAIKNSSFEHHIIIYSYLIYLMKRHENRELRASTVRNYIGILNKHVFTKFNNLLDVQIYEIEEFINRLNAVNYKNSSTKKIQILTNAFFNFSNIKHKLKIDLAALYYPKSMIFKSEIDEILEKIQSAYVQRNEIERVGKNLEFIIFQYKILVLLAFYTGLRRTELISRLLCDIYIYDDCIFVDVNNTGLQKIKQKLKSSNAKRRVKAKIDNPSHLELIQRWYKMISTKKDKNDFIFTKPTQRLSISKMPFDYKEIDFINEVIKNITKRYCSFHSLRHSYATYKIQAILNDNKQKDNPYAIIELSMLMGHVTPKITLNSYVHYDLLKLL